MVLAVLLAGCAADQSGKDTAGDAGGRGAARMREPVAEARDSAAAPAPAAERPARADEAVLVIMGTSLTAGLGLDPDEAYPALLQDKADSAGYRVRVVNAGLSGETSAGALRRVDWLLQQRADLVMLETGANDGLRGLNIDSTRANLRAILRKIRAAKPSATLFLAQMEAPPNLGDRYTGAFRAMFPAVAREEHATLVPFLLDGVAGIPRLNQGDGIHPNSVGERIVADNVWKVLAPYLARYGKGS